MLGRTLILLVAALGATATPVPPVPHIALPVARQAAPGSVGPDQLAPLISSVVNAAPTLPANITENPSPAPFVWGDSLFSKVAIIKPATAKGKQIQITGGRWLGFTSFIGIPFAEPLTGTKRFDRPQPKVYTNDFHAMAFSKACMQEASALDGGVGIGEDCLSLNILEMDGYVGTNANLPVMVWVFGGGFYGGSGSLYSALGPTMVQRGKDTGRPFILVTFNYRLGIWGWGHGEQMADAGALNNGMRDQQLALQWVKENIAAFGGDPNKVTVFGESAGAMSISLQMLNPNQNLFRAAIMQSGAQNSLPLGRPSLWQESYDETCKAAGCPVGAGSLDCLKGLSADKLMAASVAMKKLPKYDSSFPWGPSIDGDLIPDAPYKLLQEGKFSKVPFITGQNLDEGTYFVPTTITDVPGFINTVVPSPVDNATMDKILQAYPDDPALGSPFGTGNELFGLNKAFKRASAIFGDTVFTSRRRWFLRSANQNGFSKSWTYLFEGPTPILPDHLGINHAIDIPYVFGLATPLIPVGYTLESKAMSTNMMDYWINFGRNMDPNGNGAPQWPTHNFPANKNILRLLPGGVSVIQDDFREDSVALFNQPEVANVLNQGPNP